MIGNIYAIITYKFFLIYNRTGTMEAAEDCYLLTINRSGFDEIMGTYHYMMSQKKIKFLKQYSFFFEVPYLKMSYFIPYMKELAFKRRSVIYQEGESCDKIFFVINGEIEISSICTINPVPETESFFI